MGNNTFKLAGVVIVLGLILYFLFPTWQNYDLQNKLKSLNTEDSLSYVEQNRKSIESIEDNRLKLGLDLQGGMYVVLEVDLIGLIDNLAKTKDATIDSLLKVTVARTDKSGEDPAAVLVEEADKASVRLSRYYGNIQDNNSEIGTFLADQQSEAVQRALQIIRTRVDQYGVSEPSITLQGARRIIVELPGVTDEKRVRRLLKSTAKLEFKLMADETRAFNALKSINDRLAAEFAVSDSASADLVTGPETKVDTTSLAAQAGEDKTVADAADQKKNPLFARMQVGNIGYGAIGAAMEYDRVIIEKFLNRPDMQEFIPGDISFHWGAKPIAVSNEVKVFALYALEREAAMGGGSIVEARATISPMSNLPEVTMRMDADGAREWSILTGANVGKQIAIVLDNTVFSAPRVNAKITGGNSSIEGLENMEEGKDLENVLKAGALPAPIAIVQERSVGPSLGADSIRMGLISALWAFVIIAIVMVLYYNTAGMIANLALILNLIIILGVLAAFKGTLTLPGIAGMILTIGMAVDANVLIFERIREELISGKTLKATVEAGFSRAWTAIFDSNITTFFTGVILYAFGIGPIKGFALTLMIGIVTSLFTAVFVSRLTIDYLIHRPNAKLRIG